MNLKRTVHEFFGHRPVEGGYGIEVEVEGINLPHEVSGWLAKEDHSLRGEAIEYVFPRPLSLDKTTRALIKLEETLLTSEGCRVHNSRRTSVHVHRNVLNDTVLQVYNLIALYYIFEIPMTEYAGPSRIGNMYCLRASDAEFLPFQIVQSLRDGRFLAAFHGRDEVRYSGLNLTSLGRFGSAEFRAFRGTVKAQEILGWLDVIEALHGAATRFRDPLEISQSFFGHGPRKFLELIMPEQFVAHVSQFTDLEDSMLCGHQYTFEIAHTLDDWHVEEFEQPQPKQIPGRFQFAPIPQFNQPNPFRNLQPIFNIPHEDLPVFNDEDMPQDDFEDDGWQDEQPPDDDDEEDAA